MKIETEKEFMKQGLDALEGIYKVVCNLKSFDMDTLEPEKTALVIVDMVNGFIKQGQMASPRIKDIIEPIVDIKQKCDECGIQTIAFADCHCDEAVEFLSYPKHCLENSYESEIIDELKKIGVNRVIKKNSTNGFLQDEFLKWLKNNPKTTQFIPSKVFWSGSSSTSKSTGIILRPILLVNSPIERSFSLERE